MWGSFDPFAQIKKRTQGFGRRRQQFFNHQNFGHEQHNQNNGWGNNNNNGGWGNNNNNQNNGWGNEGNNNNGGWGNQGGNNGWGNQGSNNGWGNEGNNGWGNQGGQGGNNGGSLWQNSLNGIQWIGEMQKKHQANVSPFQLGDIKKFIQNQIVLIEPSPHKQKLEELKKNGQTFKDDLFPANQKSLTGEWGFQNEWKQIKWTPISQGIPNAKIFEGKIQPGDISQGYLGDCYFLAALAALAERPDRIFQLFLVNEANEQKYYSVKMLYQGKWMTIDMDQYVPFLYGKPAFTKAKQNQLWVILLEKAWAKMYSSYKRIQAGYPEQGLHDLTGAPIKQISLQGQGFDKQKEWRYLVDASQRQYSMVSSSQPGSDTNKSVSGVVQGHAYTFLNATTLNYQGNQVRIVQLRNPWGKGQFTGRWSDSDPSWNNVSPQERQRVGYNPNKQDGIFFMSWDEYCKEFRALTIAQIDDNASYIYKSHKDPQNKGCYFKVTIHKTGNYSFHVDKTPQRSYDDTKQQQFTYPLAELQIGQLNGNSIVGKRGTNSRKRTLYYDIDVEAGQYIAFVRVQYDKNFEKDFDVNLAIYAEFPCEIALASANEADVFAGRNVDWNGQQAKSNGAWNQLKGYGVLETQINNNIGGWGQQQNNNGGWNQPNNNGGMGQQHNNNNGGWGQPTQPTNNDGWGQSNNNSGWGQPTNNDGWGQQQNNNNGGWGNQGNNNGW